MVQQASKIAPAPRTQQTRQLVRIVSGPQVAGVLLTFRCRRLPENGVGDFEDVTIAVAEQCAQVPLGTSGGVMTEGFADEQVTVNIVGNQ